MTTCNLKPGDPMLPAATAVRDLRELLLNAGYRHANGAGEIVSDDGTTWVSTTFTHGEYSVYAWRRPRGYGEVSEQRFVVRVTRATDPQVVADLAEQLKRWARGAPADGDITWPVSGLAPIR